MPKKRAHPQRVTRAARVNRAGESGESAVVVVVSTGLGFRV